MQQYRESHKEKIQEQNKLWRENNKDKINERTKKYREENKEKIYKYKCRCEKYTCECGSICLLNNKTNHMKTNKHILFLENKKIL